MVPIHNVSPNCNPYFFLFYFLFLDNGGVQTIACSSTILMITCFLPLLFNPAYKGLGCLEDIACVFRLCLDFNLGFQM